MAAETKAPSIEDRELEIAEMMTCGQYNSFRTVQQLAKKWGLSVHTVQKDANAAARMLKSDPAELEGLRARMAAFFESMASNALNTANQVTGVPDYRAASEAMRLYGQYAGLRIDEESSAGAHGPVTVNVTYAQETPTDATEYRPEPVPSADAGASGA